MPRECAGFGRCTMYTASFTHGYGSPLRPLGFVSLTIYSTRHEIDACIEVGMNDVVTKPIDPRHLRGAIRRHITNQGRPTGTAEEADVPRADMARLAHTIPGLAHHGPGARPPNPATRPTLQPTRSALQGRRVTDRGPWVRDLGKQVALRTYRAVPPIPVARNWYRTVLRGRALQPDFYRPKLG